MGFSGLVGELCRHPDKLFLRSEGDEGAAGGHHRVTEGDDPPQVVDAGAGLEALDAGDEAAGGGGDALDAQLELVLVLHLPRVLAGMPAHLCHG